jgi:hypothetical protein
MIAIIARSPSSQGAYASTYRTLIGIMRVIFDHLHIKQIRSRCLWQ